MEQKQVKDWQISLYHVIISTLLGFLFSAILGSIMGFVMAISFFSIGVVVGLIPLIFVPISSAISTWISVIFSSRWINKKYSIYNKNKVVFLATSYFIAYFVVSSIVGSVVEKKSSSDSLSQLFVYMGYLSAAVNIIIFYFSSKHYLKSSPQ